MILVESMPSQKDEYFFIRLKNGDVLVFEMIFKSDYSHIIGFCWQFVRNIDKSQHLKQTIEPAVKLPGPALPPYSPD
jgi:hypothetical protein